MTNYRRNFVPGGTFFFTVNLAERRLRLLTEHIDLLRAAFRITRTTQPFITEAIVVLPDHIHAIWTLPDGDNDFATRWRLIKSAFSRALPKGERISESRRSKGERGIWQRRYWEHTLRDERDYAGHMDYIHFNPVKHGHVSRVMDWPYLSFHRLVRLGIYPPDWAGNMNEGEARRRFWGKVMGFATLNPSYGLPSPDALAAREERQGDATASPAVASNISARGQGAAAHDPRAGGCACGGVREIVGWVSAEGA